MKKIITVKKNKLEFFKKKLKEVEFMFIKEQNYYMKINIIIGK